MSAHELAQLAFERAIDRKALEPVLLDVQGRASYTEYILVVSGRSERQLRAIAEHIVDGFAQRGRRPLGMEGVGTHWVLLDYGEIVIHAFLHPIREFYDLEGLWSDAGRVALQIPPESRLSAADAY